MDPVPARPGRGPTLRNVASVWRPVAGLVALAALVAGVLTARTHLDGTEVLGSRVRPVSVEAPAPAYALATRAGLVVRFGDSEALLRDAVDTRWLPSGDLVTLRSQGNNRLQLVDPVTGAMRSVQVLGDLPGRSATRVNFLARYDQPSRIHPFTPDLERLPPVTLPLIDNLDAASDPDIRRNYYGVAATVGESTFVLWHDGSESYADGDSGVARIRGGEVDNVLLNERLVALYLSVDGAALLALRQVRGEPCGGCVVDQEVVEIDPLSGELRDYGHPADYAKRWRVDAMDKVGDRVAVRYVRVGDGRVPRERNLVGTYVYEDGGWSVLPGSDETVTWWQDGGRVLARPAREPLQRADGYRVSWVADGGDLEVPIKGELAAYFGGRLRVGAVAGRLLPPGPV